MLTESTIAQTARILADIKNKIGFVPHLFEEMNNNPATLLVYIKGQEALTHGSLTHREQQAVQLAVSTTNGCHYCRAAHQWLGRQAGIPSADLDAISAGNLPKDEPLAALVRATRMVLFRKGWLTTGDLEVLEQQGITRAKLYEIVAIIGLKTISNYVNHIAHTPIDSQFHSEKAV